MDFQPERLLTVDADESECMFMELERYSTIMERRWSRAYSRTLVIFPSIVVVGLVARGTSIWLGAPPIHPLKIPLF